MKYFIIHLFLVVFFISRIDTLHAQITFSEIMFDVASNEYHDEFVEIFNLSGSDSVDISGWTFSDSSGTDQILPHRGGRKIPPESFAIILDGSYFNNSTVYDALVPDSVIILTISDNSFGKSGLSNSLAELLTIRDSSGNILTRYKYSVGNIPGFSDEKIDLTGDNDPLNWRDSKTEGGTPGFKNSVSPRDIDFGFDQNSFFLPDLIFDDDTIILTVQIYNFGRLTPSARMDLIVFCDRNGDDDFQETDILIGRRNISTNAQTLDFNWQNVPPGRYGLTAQLFYEADENNENNKICKVIQILSRGEFLHINEIKFLTRTDEPEWIELVNISQEEILLKGWSLTDLTDTLTIDSFLSVSPEGYMVLSKDTLPDIYHMTKENLFILDKFPTLNDQGDEISLIDPAGNCREQVTYQADWLEGEAVRFPSMERINPRLNESKAENWGPSMDPRSGTPGEKNSIYSNLEGRGISLKAIPNPFSPDADGVDDITIIHGMIPETNARIRARIFDIKGRLIRTLKDNRFSGSQFDLVWDGKNQEGRTARIGIYIVYIEAINDRQGVLREMKTTVVLAQKM